MSGIHQSMGQVGLPAPITELAARQWDVVIVGGGHNGLACAAYLAKAGRSVLVLERRDRLGGACTLEQPFSDPGFAVSPCAYVVGLLDPLVIDELDLRRHGYNVFLADPALWCPFDDGTWYGQFLDHERTVAGMRENGFSEAAIKGQFEYEDFFDRMRRALRERVRDTWVGPSPGEDELRELLGNDPELSEALFETSIADVIDRFVDDPRLKRALYGQGVIGAWAGPQSPGTASIKLMHFQGTLEGVPMAWGYVEGGMGRVSFAIAEAAQEAGATLA
ncbi:MAG TPA: NAD(P)/FAD-dependent oxidoreductase, partial [Ilumatobacter sp.]